MVIVPGVQEEQNSAMRITIEHMQVRAYLDALGGRLMSGLQARMNAMQQQHDSMRQVIEQQQRALDGLMGRGPQPRQHVHQRGDG